MSRPLIVWTIVVAGGSGTRFGRPKQYELIGDERVLDRSVRVASSVSDGVVIVVPAADADREGGVAGGSTRSDSVRAGLAAVPGEADVICVHDAARPFASGELFDRVIAAVADGAAGAVPGIPVADTIKVVDANGTVVDTPARSQLVAVQTPQAFRASTLRAVHASGGDATDDAGLVEAAGEPVVVVAGEAGNRKITHPDDLCWARDQVAAEQISERDEEGM
ncbi:MAG: 2-C-methyl-D-erythritol 4-phosphate cytidylyltransferase [Ilumatobacter coccineus]|uniref:2-C-methyl-D-erythritol 4-phosphate cytidylyltransferase n=1 Tax=Ilumatobacter coccineus TaxID=467094 RepID=A0A2G6K8Y5_9ACTN|nr:MAG: 2-C-methyl-D-erythritol 4-phosphate cytidylyltransferase [Ilumatobacter coccineus]